MNTSTFPPTPSPGSVPGSGSGTTTSRCTFALELFMIVSLFVFSLFLPVVVFVFQLWWLLLLRFCWPSEAEALAEVEAYLDGGGTFANMPPALRAEFDDITEIVDAAGQFAKAPLFDNDTTQAGDLVKGLDPADAVVPGPPVSESKPDDPLCT